MYAAWERSAAWADGLSGRSLPGPLWRSRATCSPSRALRVAHAGPQGPVADRQCRPETRMVSRSSDSCAARQSATPPAPPDAASQVHANSPERPRSRRTEEPQLTTTSAESPAKLRPPRNGGAGTSSAVPTARSAVSQTSSPAVVQRRTMRTPSPRSEATASTACLGWNCCVMTRSPSGSGRRQMVSPPRASRPATTPTEVETSTSLRCWSVKKFACKMVPTF
mmetsp:Transcript_15791/g.53161  ORF Transcript_15791/g.53161 Transcript_15791/m.53161 type:complete len:223 (+) Transcript_15791:383-1051(+)